VNIPITPYFFEKLGIYERIREGDRLTTKRKTWFGEKILLKWSIRSHEHLYSSLSAEAAVDEIVEQTPSEEMHLKDPDLKALYSIANIRKVFGNLAQRGLVKITREDNKGEPDLVRFTEKGRMWGDVLLDIEEGKEWKYKTPLIILKIAGTLFVLSVIFQSLKTIISIIIEVLIVFSSLQP